MHLPLEIMLKNVIEVKVSNENTTVVLQGMSQWRWSLTDDKNQTIQESGQRPDLRDAMNDIATTVEYILDTNYCDEKGKTQSTS